MSYQVIARKYRPQNFLELIGQEHVSTALLNSLKNQRLPQALLFTGTRGVGKTSSARIFAKSIRCPNAKDFIPCNQCEECNEITRGSSVDIMEIDGASNNGVDAIRELRDSVSYMPARGKHKVYIIDEVHMLSNSAFNALLKTLEEPPAHVIFIFATTEPQKIPATILSRCQRYDFRKVSTKEIVNLVADICTKEEIEHTGDALWLIAKSANGSVRDALSALDLCISFSEKKLNEEKITSVLGISSPALRISILKSLAARDKLSLLDAIEQVASAAIEPKVFIQNLLEDLRNLILVKLDPEAKYDILDLSESEQSDFLEIANNYSEEEIHLLFDMALKGASDIQKAFEPKIVLEMVFLRMAAAPRIQFFYEKNEPFKTPTAEKKSLKAKTLEIKKNYTTEDIHKIWLNLTDSVETKNPILASKLRNCAVEKLENNLLTFSLSKEHKFISEDLNERDRVEEILSCFKEQGIALGNLKFIVNENSDAKSPIKMEEERKNQEILEIKKKIESSDLFKKTSEVFNTSEYELKELV